MQPAGAPSATKPIGQILSEAFKLYQTNLVLLVVTAALALGPVYLVKDALVAVFAGPAALAGSGLESRAQRMKDLSEELTAKQRAGQLTPAEAAEYQQKMQEAAMGTAGEAVGFLAGLLAMLVGLLLTIPLVVAANFLAQAALTVVVADRALEGKLDWKGAWGVVARNLGGLIVTTLLVAIGVAVGLVFCVLPGLAFGFLSAFAIPVVLLEKKSGVDAIRRSLSLVGADWLRVLIVFIIFAVLSWVAHFVGGIFVPDRFFFADMLIGDLVSILVLPFPVIGSVLLYQDIKKQKEQLSDAQLREQASALVAPIA